MVIRAVGGRVVLMVILAACFPAVLFGQAAVEMSYPAVFSQVPGQEPAALRGLWRFKPGDDPRFAAADFDDSGWALLSSDKPWTQQGYEGLTGFAWYRFRIVLPAGADRESILLPAIQSGYQCFLDGKLLDTEGAVGQRGTARYPLPAAIDLFLDGPRGERSAGQSHIGAHTIALRVWFDPRLDGSYEGGPSGPSVQLTSLGEARAIDKRLADYFALQLQAATVSLILSLLFFLAGLMCLSLFLVERAHPEYFWYGVAATSFGLSFWFFLDQLSHSRSIVFSLIALSIVQAGTSAGLVLFFQYLLQIRRSWLTVLVLVGILVNYACIPLEGAGLIGVSTGATLTTFSGCLFSGWVIFTVARRALQDWFDAKLLVFPVMLDFGLLFNEVARNKFPTFGGPVEVFSEHLLIDDPFPVKVRSVTAALVLLALVLVLLNRFARIRREHDRITADMKAARTIQHLLIPDVLPKVAGLTIEAAYHPAQEVGGDFFQVIPAGSGKTLIVLGDVAGKGLPAAMTVSLVVGILRTLVEFTTSPGAVLAGINSRLVGRGAGFTTCLALEIAADGTLVFANAGQLAPYRNGVEIDSEAGLPLGILSGLVFAESTTQLAEGDRLTLMTDGIPEAASDRELFGFARTEEMSQQSAEHIAAAARRFGQTDDITVLSIVFGGAEV